MITRQQADEIKRLAELAIFRAGSRGALIDYIDSLVGDDEPVAWRVECRWNDRSKGGGWRKYGDYGTLAAAESSQQRFSHPGDIESRIVPLYAAPQPPAQQRKPMTPEELRAAHTIYGSMGQQFSDFVRIVRGVEEFHKIGDEA